MYGQCVIFIACTLHQWLCDRFSILRCVYIACLFTTDCISYFTFWLEQLRMFMRNVSGQCKTDILTAVLLKIRVVSLGEWFLIFSGAVMSSPSSSCAALCHVRWTLGTAHPWTGRHVPQDTNLVFVDTICYIWELLGWLTC